jgi:hypothetical protein
MTTIECVRCKFIKANGQRCKRNTCIRKDYCWQHTSQIRNWCWRWRARRSQYAVPWTRGKVVNSNSTLNSVGRYANSCRAADKKRKKCKDNNVTMKRDFRRKHIKLKAKKTIKRGEEIYNTYGGSFRIVYGGYRWECPIATNLWNWTKQFVNQIRGLFASFMNKWT